jgi:4-amino-4-deoxy-L-arabinose transferase-like glycosyltransferase
MRDLRILFRSTSFQWALALIFCAIWLGMLGARTLVPTDEGRYAEMAREMLATGDWITTRLNGIKYFEKPPLQIWMTALAFKFFGLGEWQARLWTGLCGLSGIALTAVAGARVFGRDTGFCAALILASMLFWSAMGHINTLDMGLAGGMTLSLCALLMAQTSPVASGSSNARRNWMLACWAGMALAVLSKGLIGLALPGAVLVIYTVFARDWAIWKRLHLRSGVALFALITVPWFVLVSLRNPEFPQFFFIHEHFQRFTSKVHHRAGPWYYFVPILVAGLVPWLAVTGQSLWAAATGTKPAITDVRQTSNAVTEQPFRPAILLLVWIAFIFVFFSISGSKLPSYILPIFPAIALLIALYLRDSSMRAWSLLGAFNTILALVMLVAAWNLPRFAKDAVDLSNYEMAHPWIVAASLTFLAGGLIVLWAALRRRADLTLLATLALSISGFLAVQTLMIGAEWHGRTRAGVELVPKIEAELTPSMPLYSVGMYDQTLPFYLRRTMILVEHPDELEFGLQQQPSLWIPDQAEFVRRWRNGPKAIAVTRKEIFDRLQSQGVPMRIIAQDGRRIVITNQLQK